MTSFVEWCGLFVGVNQVLMCKLHEMKKFWPLENQCLDRFFSFRMIKVGKRWNTSSELLCLDLISRRLGGLMLKLRIKGQVWCFFALIFRCFPFVCCCMQECFDFFEKRPRIEHLWLDLIESSKIIWKIESQFSEISPNNTHERCTKYPTIATNRASISPQPSKSIEIMSFYEGEVGRVMNMMKIHHTRQIQDGWLVFCRRTIKTHWNRNEVGWI